MTFLLPWLKQVDTYFISCHNVNDMPILKEYSTPTITFVLIPCYISGYSRIGVVVKPFMEAL